MVPTTMKTTLLVVVVLMLPAASCRRRAPAAQVSTQATPLPAVSTVPATVPGHLTLLRASLITKQEQYLEHEGPKHRGHLFQALVSQLLLTTMREPPVTESETLEVLGRPDYFRNGGDTTYVYLYDNYFGVKGACLVYVDAAGLVTQIGYNTANSIGLNRFSRYPQPPSLPTTQP